MVREASSTDPDLKKQVTVRVTTVAANSLNVKVKNGRLDLRKNFFSVRAFIRWDEVPLEMKRIMPVHLFRQAYRRHRDAMLPDA